MFGETEGEPIQPEPQTDIDSDDSSAEDVTIDQTPGQKAGIEAAVWVTNEYQKYEGLPSSEERGHLVKQWAKKVDGYGIKSQGMGARDLLIEIARHEKLGLE